MKVALIGYGYWGKILRRYIDESTYFELSKICAKNDDEFNYNLEDIAQDQEIKAVFIATPLHTHFDLCKKFLSHRKHVFCEKPLAKTSEEILLLKSLAQKMGVIVETNYIYTDSPSINKIKSSVSGSEEKIFVEGNIKQFGKLYKNESVFEVIGCHLLSTLYYFFEDEHFEFFFLDDLNQQWIYEQCGCVMLKSNRVTGYFSVSLRNSERIREVKVYCKNKSYEFNMMSKNTMRIKEIILENGQMIVANEETFNYDETNNISSAVLRFYNNIRDQKSNIDLSYKVTKSIESILGGNHVL